MPKFDGTGPSGQGAGTGRGLGPCGAGMARGRGFGFGRCRWMGNGFGGGYISASEEKDFLKQDIEDTESYLKSARKRLSDLDREK